jgi:hypothetical protein
VGPASTAGPPSAAGALATLVHDPFAALGSTRPDLDAGLAAHAVVGHLSGHLWRRTRPAPADVERIVAFCLRAAGRT